MKKWLWDSMNTVAKLYESFLLPVCEKYDLTRAELDILLFFANNPQYDRAADVIEVRKVAKSHVSVSIKSLLAKGYLKGIYQEDNARDVHLKVMKKADGIVNKGRFAQEQFEKTLFHGLTKEQIEVMKANIDQMMRNAKEYYGENK